MKLLIAGSRRLTNIDPIKRAIDKVLQLIHWHPTEVLSGGCVGADACGEQWAISQQIIVTKYLPVGPKPAAFHIRNEDMAKNCDLAILFMYPDEASNRGTKSTERFLNKHKKSFFVFVIDNLYARFVYCKLVGNWWVDFKIPNACGSVVLDSNGFVSKKSCPLIARYYGGQLFYDVLLSKKINAAVPLKQEPNPDHQISLNTLAN